jgi:hypothetical protein
MIDTLLDLAQLFARDGLPFDKAAARLGRITEPGLPGGPTEIAPTDPRFEEVKLWRDTGTGAPYLLDVELAPTARVPVADLTKAFGPFEPVRTTTLGATPKILFRAVAKGQRFVATITARVEGPRDHLEAGTVTGLSILRDARVE